MPGAAPLLGIGLLAVIAVLLGTGTSKAAPRKRKEEAGDEEKALAPSDAPPGPGPDIPPPTAEDKVFSPPVQDKIKEAEETDNPEPLKEAADMAREEGKDSQAAALDKAYDGKRVESGTVVFKSPIANVKPEFWTRFANCVKGDNPRKITPGFALGLYGFGARRLVDLGAMTDPHMGTYKGRSVWTGRWVPPLDINKFLADSALQYKLFYASMRDYAMRLRDNPAAKLLIGRQIDGVPITLSGILGVAHRAGWSGAMKWFASPSDRAKFTATTKAFKDCNGIF